MNANAILLQKKYARVIELYADKYHVSPEMSLDRFYKSYLYHQISEGISDLHCMSDDYLADELNEEWSQSSHYSTHLVRITDSAVIIRFVANEKLKLHIVRIGFYDDLDMKIDVNIGAILAVISEDGYSEKTFNFPDNRKYRSAQFIVKDSEHQEQYSITVLFDGTVNARQMPYNS